MRILLVNPPMPGKQCHPPLGLLSIASMNFKKTPEISIKDYNYIYHTRKMDIRNVYDLALQEIDRSKYDVVGITSNNYTLPFVFSLCNEMRKFKGFIVLGGPGVSFVAGDILKKLSNVNIVVRGEGEIAFQKLVENSFNCSSEIPNISYRSRNGRIYDNFNFLIGDLDILPYYHGCNSIEIDVYQVKHPYTDVRQAIIEIGRGCPFSCPFCSTSQMWGRKFRMKSINRVKNEISQYKENGYTQISFIHDNIACSKEYLKALCDEMSKFEISWTCSISPNYLSPDSISNLNRGNCVSIFIGLESGSNNILADMPHKIVKDLDGKIGVVVKSFDFVTTSLILGHPKETEKSFSKTVSLSLRLKKLGVTDVQLHQYNYLPGTDDYKCFEKKMTDDVKISSEIDIRNIIDTFDTTIKLNRTLFSNFFFLKPDNLKSYPNLHKQISCINLLVNNCYNTIQFLTLVVGLDISDINSALVKHICNNTNNVISQAEVLDQILQYYSSNPNKSFIVELNEIVSVEKMLEYHIKNYPLDSNMVVDQGSWSVSKDVFVFKHLTDTHNVLIKTPGCYIYKVGGRRVDVFLLSDAEFEMYEYLKGIRLTSGVDDYILSNKSRKKVFDNFINLNIVKKGGGV